MCDHRGWHIVYLALYLISLISLVNSELSVTDFRDNIYNKGDNYFIVPKHNKFDCACSNVKTV